jgi:hypothetical protein
MEYRTWCDYKLVVLSLRLGLSVGIGTGDGTVGVGDCDILNTSVGEPDGDLGDGSKPVDGTIEPEYARATDARRTENDCGIDEELGDFCLNRVIQDVHDGDCVCDFHNLPSIRVGFVELEPVVPIQFE